MPVNKMSGGLSTKQGTLFDTNVQATAIDEDIFTDQTLLEAGADGDLMLTLDVSETPDVIKYITRTTLLGGYPKLTGSTNNTLVTVTGTDAIAGEANLTFDTSTNILQIGASADIEPRLDFLNDENSAQIGLANATDDMVTGSADGDLVINSVGDHSVIIAQNDTKAITLDTDGDVTFANNIDGGTWLGTTIAVANGGTGATSLSNLITMGTHTTGNYVATVTAGTGLTSDGATSGESVTHSLSVDASQGQITTVGALNAGSITSGFTSIDVGSGAITTTGALSIGSMGTNWTNAGRTVADMGIVTTIDINGGTINGITDLAVADGGTGASSLTDNAILTGTGASAITAESTLAFTGDVLTASSTSADLPMIELTNTHAGATAGKIRFNKDTASGDDNDVMGTIEFFGTDAGEATHEKLAYIDSYVVDATAGGEQGGLRFYVAENAADLALGLSLVGQAEDGEVDVTVGAGAASVTTIAGTLTMGSTAAMTNAGLVSVANQSGITGLGTITSGTWQGTTVAVNQGGTGATSLTNLITLASHTTGDYVQNITGGTGLTSTGATSGENIAHTLSVDASQTQITAVGTIATGVWEGTDVGVSHGGTGASTATAGFDALSPMTAEGDILYGGSSGTVTKLAKGSDADVLTLASGVPSWATPTTGDITGVTAGVGLSGGGNSGGVTLTLDLSELSAVTPTSGDSFSTLDNDGAVEQRTTTDALATLLAGTGLTASSAVISVDDDFLKNDASDTTTGTITAAGFITGGDVFIDSTPADTVYSGITASYTAGEALEDGEVVYLKAADSKVWKAVASATATSRAIGMVVADASAEAAVTVLLQGFLRADTNFPTWTIGGALYTPEAETSGKNVPEQAAPDSDGDFVQVLGWASDANTVYFNPSNDIIEHA